eukprot:gene16507-19601_t
MGSIQVNFATDEEGMAKELPKCSLEECRGLSDVEISNDAYSMVLGILVNEKIVDLLPKLATEGLVDVILINDCSADMLKNTL